MDLIVCGDALWVTCGTWVAIWGGTFGAFVAAVIGGLVALFVVRLTNRHQSRIASEARSKAAASDMAAAMLAMNKRYVDGPEAINELVLAADAAALRWAMETRDKDLAEELGLWPHVVALFGLDMARKHEDDSMSDDTFKRLTTMTGNIYLFVINFHRTKRRRDRARLVAELKHLRVTQKRINEDETVPAPE